MKEKTVYTCQKCGYQSPKWLGKCPDCNSWNTLVEEVRFRGEKRPEEPGTAPVPTPINEVSGEMEDRFSCGISEFDRVLGGGIVAGSLVLIGGDPGIGKFRGKLHPVK